MRKIILAFILAVALAVAPACLAATYPDEVFTFALDCREYGINISANKNTTVSKTATVTRVDFIDDGYEFAYTETAEQYWVVLNFGADCEMWATVAALRAVAGMEERDAYMLFYDLVYADKKAENTTVTSGNVTAQAAKLENGAHDIQLVITK